MLYVTSFSVLLGLFMEVILPLSYPLYVYDRQFRRWIVTICSQDEYQVTGSVQCTEMY